MHRAFITGADVEAYESPERARQIRSEQNAEAMAQHAYDARVSHQGNRGELSPSQTTFPSDSTHELGPNEAAMLAGKYRKHAPVPMDIAELSEGPNLPHRDDSGISRIAQDTSRKVGYYQAGTDAFSSDAYMGKRTPIDRKANDKRTFRNGKGEIYVLPQGLSSKYSDPEKHDVANPHQVDGWGKPLTAGNKHLSYWRNPTEREALANVTREGRDTAPTEPVRYIMTIPREFLVTLARIHDIQAQRGRLHGDNRGDMLRDLATKIAPGETADVEWFTPTEVLGMTQKLPKRYRKGYGTGEFGQFLKDTATFAKLNK